MAAHLPVEYQQGHDRKNPHPCKSSVLSLHGAGVSLAGDVSIPAESPALQAEASATTSHSPSPLPQNPPDSSALLEAALSPELGTDSIPHFGCLHHLHAASNLISGVMLEAK